MQTVFEKLPAITTGRGNLGDSGAATQALDLVAAAWMLERGQLCPTLNCDNPILDMPMVRGASRSAGIEHVLVAARSLAGQHAAVIFSRYQEE